jgi:hypothetical protein
MGGMPWNSFLDTALKNDPGLAFEAIHALKGRNSGYENNFFRNRRCRLEI